MDLSENEKENGNFLFPENEVNPTGDFTPNLDFDNDFNFHTAPLFTNSKIPNKTIKNDIIQDANLVSKNKYCDSSPKLEEDTEKIEKDTLLDDEDTHDYPTQQNLCGDEIIDLTISSDSDCNSQEKIKLNDSEEESIPKKLEWATREPIKKDQSEYDQIEPKIMKYPFELDPFQKQAIVHLQKGESVFVSAHTSAGKTVIAEHAIALSISHLTRAIYTSPIKTLSNQKFRDFKKAFGDVGILTGDVSINPEASCLILTTEIFRSILYKGSEIVRDIEWVIFDEVHYINDYERGVVWEEVIIMLPEHINIILLSATVPNALEFANWVGMTKKKQIYVIGTHKRPVPLRHYMWRTNKLFPLIKNGIIDKSVCTKIRNHEGRMGNKTSEGGRGKYNNSWLFTLTNFLKKQELMPTVVFVFSRKGCNHCARQLMNQNFNNKKDRDKIRLVMQQALKRLSGNDKNLPQIVQTWRFLENGIGVHHAGLLPIIKEVVEMCFARGLVKMLFATETFAMGVNMPARTVVFENYRKHDGRSFRMLLSGEYIQMSGRAGRRGLDQFGTIIIVAKDNFQNDEKELLNMLSSQPAKLQSKFKVTYNMILNLFKTEGANVEDVIRKSFDQFHSQKDQSSMLNTLKENRRKLDLLKMEKEGEISVEVEKYLGQWQALKGKLQEINLELMMSSLAAKYFCPGRIVLLCSPNSVRLIPAVIVKVVTGIQKKQKELQDTFTFVAVTFCSEVWDKKKKGTKLPEKYCSASSYCQKNGVDRFITGKMVLSDIFVSTKYKIKKKEISNAVYQNDKREIVKIFKKTMKKLDRDEDLMGDFLNVAELVSLEIGQLIEDSYNLLHKLEKSEFHKNADFVEQFFLGLNEKKVIEKEVNQLQFLLSDESVYLLEVFKRKVDILKALEFINDDHSVTIKGRIACEINNCNSLILTELIFENVLSELEPEEIVSLLSCLLFEKSDTKMPRLTPIQEMSLQSIINVATRIGTLQEEFKIDMPCDEFVRKNANIGLMEVVYRWAKGDEFSRICSCTDVQEGSIVRNIVRLDETCRDVKNAARVMGDPELFRKMETASSLIKRDIVFTASLYLL